MIIIAAVVFILLIFVGWAIIAMWREQKEDILDDIYYSRRDDD